MITGKVVKILIVDLSPQSLYQISLFISLRCTEEAGEILLGLNLSCPICALLCPLSQWKAGHPGRLEVKQLGNIHVFILSKSVDTSFSGHEITA